MTPAGTPADRQKRQTAQKRGLRAERIAAWWLRLKGYRIVGHDLRTPAGQVDLLVRRGRVLAVVEVKQRDDLRTALESVTARQQARLTGAAGALLARYPALAGLDLRFDAVLIVPGRRPRHLPDAWRPR